MLVGLESGTKESQSMDNAKPGLRLQVEGNVEPLVKREKLPVDSTEINVWGYGLRKSKVARKEESTDDMVKELHSMANVVVLSKVVDSAGYLVKRGTTPVIPIGVNVWSDRIFL